MEGLMLVLLGAGLAAGLGCVGSAVGCSIAGQAAAGVVSEDPEKFGRLLLLQALPGTQGIYGVVGLFLIVTKLSGIPFETITVPQGLSVLFSSLPLALSALVSAIYQGIVCASACGMVAKRPDELGKGMVFGIVVETYAILGLLSTIILLGRIKLGA